MTDIPTLANGAAPSAPPAADPGDFGPAVERAAKPPAPERPSFEQQRHAQEQARAQTKPPANPQEAPPAPVADQQQPAPPAGEKIKVGKYETTESELAAMLERQSQDDLRKATVPTTPQDYKLAIPDGMKLPGDVDFRFDEAGNKAALMRREHGPITRASVSPTLRKC